MASFNKPFYFMRHAETDWSRQHIYIGSKDISLNSYGESQARKIAELLKYEVITRIVSSPLRRAMQTAKIISSSLGKDYTVINNFSECCWGVKEGTPITDSLFLKEWLSGVSHVGVEHINDFEERVRKGLSFILNYPAPVLIIAHGAIYCAIQKILKWPINGIEYCSPVYHRPPENPKHPWLICPLDMVY
jgi:probable phosphoglycerate mutase